MIDSTILLRIENKLFYYPGFCEGVVEVADHYYCDSVEQFEKAWVDIKRFLKYYRYTTTFVSTEGLCMGAVSPFSTEEDFELAKYIIISFFE
ncbi:hypothetical protein [Mucilaginibacter sp. SP1R1]|uniref:hypothetical protein n=1 Tax=Mucilaginibacter sp. SP1R1 TaxID=2723091 RepID=UPI001615B5A5|nr:hypothetical protein [Mucilaginibacter sp. SP1R1]MBB6149823.1 hypothetical protein [Mucilaginibacter sp. SP1R1]